MIIKRDRYLNQLIERRNNGLIKVITGIRRCGKSFLLFELFTEYLKENGNDQYLDFIGKFKYTSNLRPETVAQDIIQKINFNLQVMLPTY